MNEVFPGGSPDEERLLQLLEDAYLEARYNLRYEIGKQDLDLVSSRVFRLLELAEAVFESKMQVTAVVISPDSGSQKSGIN